MGYDLYGIKAKSQKGEYFRNNVWWWRKLWTFICLVSPDILSAQDMQKGHWNNGDEITEQQAEFIAKRLKETLKNGQAQQFSKNVQNSIKKAKHNNKNLKFGEKGWDYNDSYPFSLKNLKEFITFCENSGGFTIF